MTWLRAAFVVIGFWQFRAFKRDLKRTLQVGRPLSRAFDMMLRRHLTRMILFIVAIFIGAFYLSRHP